MNVRPLQDRVLIKRIESEQKTAGGLFIPDTAQEKQYEGRVLAVGPGARSDQGELLAPSVSEGDRVLFGKYAGTEIKVEGEDLLILREDEILGVLVD